MDSALHRLLRLAVACLLLSAAWGHLYWEAPYRAALEAQPGLASLLRVAPEAGEHIALGFGIWFLVAGGVTVLGRPGWMVRTILIFSLVPLALLLASEASIQKPAWHWVMTRSWWLGATLALVIAGCGWSGAERLFLRAGLTAAFATWAVEALGGLGAVPENWLAAVRTCWPGGQGDVVHVQVLAGLVLGGCVCLWIRPLVPAGAILLALSGVAVIGGALTGKLDGPALELWHRWMPEAAGKAGLAVLPVAVWLAGGSRRRLRPEPRRLKRVETPPGEA